MEKADWNERLGFCQGEYVGWELVVVVWCVCVCVGGKWNIQEGGWRED